MEQENKLPFIAGGLGVVLMGIILSYVTTKGALTSPIPREEEIKVIFVSPPATLTPAPSLLPTPTPKAKKPTVTPRPKATVTPGPTVTPSVSPLASPSATPKP